MNNPSFFRAVFPDKCVHRPRITRRHHILSLLLWWTLLGAGLFLCTIQSELLWFPPGWTAISRLVYRIPFLLIAPARLLVMPFFPRVNHHWSLAHFAVASFLTPFLWGGIYQAIRYAIKHNKKKRNLAQKPRENSRIMPRREFLARSAAGITCAAATGAGGYATLVEPSRLVVRSYQVRIKNLPAELEGFRIAHVSDTHYGPFTDIADIQKMVNKVNRLKPDIVALTGDYVHFTPASIVPGIEALAGLKARVGRVAVLGNHEHWEGAEACRNVLEKIGIPILDNTRRYVSSSALHVEIPDEACICLAGFADLWEDVISFEDALKDIPENLPRIVLSHNPDAAELVPTRYRVDLMLSGHTHGGQVRLPILGAVASVSEYGEKYLGGYCQGPRFPVIVSRGVGMAMLPVRFGVPPEVGIISLTRS